MKKIQNYLSKIQWKNILKILLSIIIVFLILFSSFSCMLSLPTYAAEGDTITLKAGTYRLNDVVDVSVAMYQDIDYIYYYDSSVTSKNGVAIDIQNNLLSYVYDNSNGVVGDGVYINPVPDDLVSYFPNGWRLGDVNVQTITITNDSEVDDTFGTWFIANTNYNEVNGDDVQMLIKAGRYQFNDSLSFSTSINENDYDNIHFIYNNSEYHGFRFISQSSGGTDITTMTFLNGNNIADGTLIYAKQLLVDGSVSETYNGYQVDTPVVVDVLSDQEVPIYIALEFLNNVQIVDSGGGTCPTLPELLNDYTGSFDSIVDMLNTKNYREYEAYIEYKYNQGYNAGASDDFVNGFFGNMLTGAVRAIDAIVIYRSGDFYISVWTVLTTIVITSLMLGLLKIWRGG